MAKIVFSLSLFHYRIMFFTTVFFTSLFFSTRFFTTSFFITSLFRGVSNKKSQIRSLFVLTTLGLIGCSEIPRTPPPTYQINATTEQNYSDVRASAGRISQVFMDDLIQSYRDEDPAVFSVTSTDEKGRNKKILRYPHLVLSGGGPNGAFGAGVLAGWSQADRPVFKIVTGVSTGALMAPFAFLGSEYDEKLRHFYTTTQSRDIFLLSNPFVRLLFSDSFAETTPLENLIAQDITLSFLQEIAKEHDKGRRLYMATSNLDAQSLMIWNMGLIAKQNNNHAVELFRQVMLASASIPVAFPPVMFDVMLDGKQYDELHVDGAVGANMFYSAGVFNTVRAREAAGIAQATESVFIIHNGQLRPIAKPTSRSISSIAARTFDSVTKAAAIGDIHRIYAMTLRQDYDFAWVTIPEEIDLTSGEQIFDPILMRKLYDAGLKMATPKIPWRTLPPGVQE